MTSKSSLSSGSKLILIVLASIVSSALCKSFNVPYVTEDKLNRVDPLMALPTEFMSHNSNGAIHAQPQIQYIVQHEPQVSNSEQPRQQVTKLANSNEQPRQEVRYVLVKPEGETLNNQPDTPVEEDCNQRERGEYMVAPTQDHVTSGQISENRQDYPGEIVYVSQNGETRQSGNNQQEQENYAAVSQTSGVPATILTEIPIRDMPYEVLEKLKRDYGVKVVATRERPGANLVINCDDYTGQGQTICSRQGPSNQAQANGLYSANLALDEQNVAHLQRESSPANGLYGVDNNPEVRQGTYVTRNGETRVANVATPQADSQNFRERFGSRSYLTLGRTEPSQQERPEEMSAPVESHANEKTEIQHEGGIQDSGFEAQPDASVDSSEAEQTNKNSQ